MKHTTKEMILKTGFKLSDILEGNFGKFEVYHHNNSGVVYEPKEDKIIHYFMIERGIKNGFKREAGEVKNC